MKNRRRMLWLTGGGVLLTASALLATSSTRIAQRGLCLAIQVTSQRAAQWAGALQRAAGHQAVEREQPGLETAAVAAPVSNRCLSLVTLSWGNGLSGGVLFVDETGVVVARYPGFPGATSPMEAGPGRVVFEYVSERGSGVSESRLVALCALAEDLWVKCADIMKNRIDQAAGYPPADSAAVGMMMRQHAEVSVHGDSLVLSRRASYRRYGDRSQTNVDLGRTTVLLPPSRTH